MDLLEQNQMQNMGGMCCANWGPLWKCSFLRCRNSSLRVLRWEPDRAFSLLKSKGENLWGSTGVER